MLYDEALRKAKANGVTLEHSCDERAQECSCTFGRVLVNYIDGTQSIGHEPGNDECPERARHSACSYAQQSVDMLPIWPK